MTILMDAAQEDDAYSLPNPPRQLPFQSSPPAITKAFLVQTVEDYKCLGTLNNKTFD